MTQPEQEGYEEPTLTTCESPQPNITSETELKEDLPNGVEDTTLIESLEDTEQSLSQLDDVSRGLLAIAC